MVKLPQIGEAMDCKELDRISRSGHPKIFEDEIRSVLKDIDLGINRTPIFLRYNAYDIKGFANEENFFRIPCASRTVYCRKVHDFWNNKYEIVYRTNLNMYGHTSRYELMRSVLIEFPDFVPVELTEDVCQEVDASFVNVLNLISTRSF